MRTATKRYMANISIMALLTISNDSFSQIENPDRGETPNKNSQIMPPTPHLHTNGELTEMQKYIDERIDRATVRKSLVTVAGRKVDCVDINVQPALQNPLFRGHQVRIPAPLPIAKDTPKQLSPVLFENIGNMAVAVECPDGTVPIPEVTMKDLVRFDSMAKFFSKLPGNLQKSAQEKTVAPPTLTNPLHEYAVAMRNQFNYGAAATINIWNPSTGLPSEFSLGQIWVVGGSGLGTQTVETGAQKYINLYGDSYIHLFTYSTRQNYADGCYNNTCGDFIQISRSIFPGMPIPLTSTYNGTQIEARVSWAKLYEGWWLIVNDEMVGYYPNALFSDSGLKNGSNLIEFGGEIVNFQTSGGLHTTTDMGAGTFSSGTSGQTAYMRNIVYHNTIHFPGDGVGPYIIPSEDSNGMSTYVSRPTCYDIRVGYQISYWKSFLYYGGPGYDSLKCR